MTLEIAAARASAAPAGSVPVELKPPVANVYEVNPLHDSRWEALVSSHPRSSVFHSTKWLRSLQTTYGYEPVVVTTCSPGAVLSNGLVFCQVKSWLTGRRLVSLPFSDHCEPLVNNSTELDHLLLHMNRDVDAGKWRYVEIRPILCQPGSQTGFGRSITYSFHRLDLRKSGQELLHSFHKDCVQRKIRRAEREKLRCEEGTSESLLQKFYRLQVMTRRRQHLPPQPISWFRALVAEFGDSVKIRVASKDDLAIASILTITHKKSMVYKYGCSDARFHKFGGTALLFWNAIQEANDKGLDEFEMGRSDGANHGLIAFKEHWGAVRSELNYWTYASTHRVTSSTPSKAMMRQFVRVAPDPILKLTGRLFYRHIG